MFGAFSIAVTGRFQVGLIATDEEEARLGKHLAACLDTLPAPVGEAISKGGPWLALGSDLGGMVLSRMAVLQQASLAAQHRRGLRTVSDGPPPGASGPIAADGGIVAPDPSQVPPNQPASPWAASVTGIIAPEPVPAA
jgi:hypothetical protein